jgi:hypothetical protein
MRVGEWLQETEQLSNFEHAEKNDNELSTSLQLGHNS